MKILLIGLLLQITASVCSQNDFIMLSNTYPVVDVSVNGRTCTMLIDTGTSLNLIDDNQLKSFKVSRRFKMGDAQGVGDSTELYHVNNCKVDIEGIPVYQFVSSDLSNIVNSIEAETNIKISCILGIPAIKEAELIINPSTNEISIGYKD